MRKLSSYYSSQIAEFLRQSGSGIIGISHSHGISAYCRAEIQSAQ